MCCRDGSESFSTKEPSQAVLSPMAPLVLRSFAHDPVPEVPPKAGGVNNVKYHPMSLCKWLLIQNSLTEQG